MNYSLRELLQGMQIKDNPNAGIELFILIILVIVFALISVFILKLPSIRRKLWDEEVFKFIMEFKKITVEEKEMIDSIIKKYNLKKEKKYNLLIIESIFQKYVDVEMIRIENSIISKQKKDEKIENYVKLKKKLFYADI